MARKPRPSVSEILRFSEQLSALCTKYNAEAWFHTSGTRFALYDLPSLPKSYIRSGWFGISFYPNPHTDWSVYLWQINMIELEVEFVSRLLGCVFEV